jgi:uncharacterized protein YwqG
MMTPEIERLLEKCEINRLKPFLEKYLLPCVGFDLKRFPHQLPIGASKLGGEPDLPGDFVWSENNGRPLDFLLQVNLSEASKLDKSGQLPTAGLLSFFYDLEDQPEGYDPKNLDGYKVVFSPSPDKLQKWAVPDSDYKMDEFGLILRADLSVPDSGSDEYEKFAEESDMTREEDGGFWKFAAEIERREKSYTQKYGGHHRILGHSENIQGDMRWEAQLVMNGLYCGDSSGYNDPRREELEKNSDDWILLLQLDSDEKAGLLWSDVGMLYYWIRKQDLAARNFDEVWMTMQCC